MLSTKTRAEIVAEFQEELDKLKKLREANCYSGSNCTDFLWGLLAEKSRIKYIEGSGGIILGITLSGLSSVLSEEDYRDKPSLVKFAIAEAIAKVIYIHKIHLSELNEKQLLVTIP